VNRLKEGDFINASLKDLRDTIQDIIGVKNADAIDIVPNFIDICLSDYCPKYNNCFKQTNNSTLNYTQIKSVLIRSIFNKLYPNANSSGKIEEYIKLFYREIQICAFCVFNMSRERANNPPPVPYIDINSIKTFYYLHSDVIYDDATIYNFKHPTVESQNEIQYPTKPDKKYVLNIRNTFYTECLKLINIIDNKYNGYNTITIDGKPELDNGRSTMISTIQKDAKYKSFKNFVNNQLKQFVAEINDPSRNTRKSIFENKDVENTPVIDINKNAYDEIFTNFIEMIDNTNAISSVGTLEFMDQITKFNQTNILCTLDNTDPTKYGVTEIMTAYILQEDAKNSLKTTRYRNLSTN
jgi:hypothetical protein